MEKFELLYSVLKNLDAVGVLDKVVLIGSWCQDFYKLEFAPSNQIPAARTTDADILIPKKINIHSPINIPEILKKHGFVKETQSKTGVTKFSHPDLKLEFLTNAGAKSNEGAHEFKKLKIVAQELHFMGIPEHYNKKIQFRELNITVPEPEAFALHKLIVSQRRFKPEKAAKDFETAKALFKYFEGKEKHTNRLKEILATLPKGWQDRIHRALEDSDLKVDYIQRKQIEENITMFQADVTTKDLETHTYKIGLRTAVIQDYSKEKINNVLNGKAQKIIAHDSKLKNKEILEVKITRMENGILKKGSELTV